MFLSGQAPFEGDSDYKILNSIKTGKVNYENLMDLKINGDAIDLVERLLQVEVSSRITAESALKHTWLSKYQPVGFDSVANEHDDQFAQLVNIKPGQLFK